MSHIFIKEFIVITGAALALGYQLHFAFPRIRIAFCLALPLTLAVAWLVVVGAFKLY